MGLYRATLHCDQDGQTIDVITGWVATPATNAGDAAIIADRVYQGFVSYFLNDLVDDLNVNSCDVIGVDNGTVFGTFSGSASGAYANPPAPMFVVANVKLSTGIRGRSYTGRFGIPGIPLDAVDANNGNNLASAWVAVLQGDLGDFINHVETGPPSPKLAVVSTISGGTPRVTPIGTEVTTATVMTPFGSRVSRKG